VARGGGVRRGRTLKAGGLGPALGPALWPGAWAGALARRFGPVPWAGALGRRLGQCRGPALWPGALGRRLGQCRGPAPWAGALGRRLGPALKRGPGLLSSLWATPASIRLSLFRLQYIHVPRRSILFWYLGRVLRGLDTKKGSASIRWLPERVANPHRDTTPHGLDRTREGRAKYPSSGQT
jgi:hypothetical protein